MLDFLYSLFKKPVQMPHIAVITSNISAMVQLFDEEYMHDKNAKNAAIDAVIKLLEQHKDTNIS